MLLSSTLRLNHTALTLRLGKRAGLPVQAHRRTGSSRGRSSPTAPTCIPSARRPPDSGPTSTGWTRPGLGEGDPRRRLRSQPGDRTPPRNRGAEADDHPSRHRPTVAARSMESSAGPDSRPPRRLIRKYVSLVAALVVAALLTSGLTDLYFSYEDNKDSLRRIQREKASTTKA